MATDAGEIFRGHPADHRLGALEGRNVCAAAEYVRTTEESKALTANPMPKIIISASGMATGGRVLHHLKRYAPDAKNTILFSGYQAAGTRGAAMVAGATSIKIQGAYIPVQAEIHDLDALSAHADQEELMRWLRGLNSPPRTTFITHGEPIAADALRHRIEEDLRWQCVVPEQRDKVELR
jgi:metallo-beta-lactamase family protein